MALLHQSGLLASCRSYDPDVGCTGTLAIRSARNGGCDGNRWLTAVENEQNGYDKP